MRARGRERVSLQFGDGQLPVRVAEVSQKSAALAAGQGAWGNGAVAARRGEDDVGAREALFEVRRGEAEVSRGKPG